MNKIKEIELGINEKVRQMDELSKKEKMSEDEIKTWDQLEAEVENLNKDLKRAQKMEELNKRAGIPTEVKKDEPENFISKFRSALKDSYDTGVKNTLKYDADKFRADPIVTTTDAGIINKITGDINVLYSQGESFLFDTLGVTRLSGLKGNYTLPSMAQSEAEFVNEAADGSTANLASASITLAGRRLTHSQAITVETLEQSNDSVFRIILENLNNGLWYKIVKDLFTQAKSDGASQLFTKPTSQNQMAYVDIVRMKDSSLGGVMLNDPKFVCNGTTLSYFESTIKLGTTAGSAISENGKLAGLPIYSIPQIGSDELHVADWKQAVVGEFGDTTFIIDPLTLAASGQIKVTASKLVDTGLWNKRAYTYCADCSTY